VLRCLMMKYQEEREFWQSICNQVLTKNSVLEQWKTLPQQRFGNGTIDDSGNPILRMLNEANKRGVRIIILPPEQQDIDNVYMEINYDITCEGLDDLEEFEQQMVFWCTSFEDKPAEDSAKFFMELFEKWSDLKISYEEMDKIIKSHMKRLYPNDD
jgi:hypothetical protein